MKTSMISHKTDKFSVLADDPLDGADNILVKDDFFKDDLSNLIAKGTATYQWNYHHKSDVSDPTHNKFFVSHLWNESAGANFFSMLWTLIHKRVPPVSNYYCWRIIANGQVKGQNGNWHVDHGDKTLLYFPLTWRSDWGGSTHFKVHGEEKEITYRQNRLIVFDSDILHYGSCPSIDNVLRISIAFNLRLWPDATLKS